MSYWYGTLNNVIQRAHKYRFYPTSKHIEQLGIEFSHARLVWNWALGMRTKAKRGKIL